MEVEHFFVPGGGGFHFTIRLVTDTVVDDVELDWLKNLVEGFLEVVGLVAGKESSIVLVSLDESMGRVTVGLNRRADNLAIVIFERVWLSNRFSTPLNGLFIDASCVIYGERDILDSISMLCMVVVEFGVFTILG